MRNMVDRLLLGILVVLSASVLVTGGLAVYLTLARQGGAVAGDEVAPTVGVTTTVTTVAPDEPRIAFISDEAGEVALYVIDADGSNQRRVSDPERDFCIRPYWSPDGRYVAYLERLDSDTGDLPNIGVWVSAADGGEHTRVSQAISRVLGTDPMWSPDGTRLAFASLSEPMGGEPLTSTIHVAALDGGVEQRFPLPWVIEYAVWSPAGDEWLLVTDGGVYTLSGEEGEIVEVFVGARTANWSPDGEEVVVGDQASNSVLVVGQDLEPRLIAELKMDPVEVAWSPDGAHIAVTAAQRYQQGYGDALYIVTLETGDIVPVIENEGWALWPNWSPDGSQLLFTMGPPVWRTGSDLPYADLWVYDVASGRQEQLTLGEGFEGLGIWSP